MVKKRFYSGCAAAAALLMGTILTGCSSDETIEGGESPVKLAESTAVDLGLPSGLKWAAGNVGADKPEDCGLYFAWGETTGYTVEQVKSGEQAFTQDEYLEGTAASISTDLTLEQDAAHVNLGGNWRMPTYDEWQELIDNCYVVWTENYGGTGVVGRVFTSRVNGNSVFLPAAGNCHNSFVDYMGSYGCYSSASLRSYGYSGSASWGLFFGSEGLHLDIYSRFYGRSVRGVCK